MTLSGGKARREEPFFWWGPGWNPPPRRTLRELLVAETLDLRTASYLWCALYRRCSLAVVAGASGAGKSTLLAALLDFLPAATTPIHVRGCYETFAFRADPHVDPNHTALLANEVSPHLPVYLWGPGVATFLACRRDGYQLLTTAHAANAQEFVVMLAGSPLRLAPGQIAAIEFVTALAAPAAKGEAPRVVGLWRMAATQAGIALDPPPERSNISQEGENGAWFPAEELRAREYALGQLRAGRIEVLPPLPILPDGT